MNGYIADIHGNENIPGLSSCVGAALARSALAAPAISPRPSTTTRRSRTSSTRLAADGITPKNTLFMISSDEGDHVAGANVGRAIQPTPANCDGATVAAPP